MDATSEIAAASPDGFKEALFTRIKGSGLLNATKVRRDRRLEAQVAE
jgi:hypothetical protein